MESGGSSDRRDMVPALALYGVVWRVVCALLGTLGLALAALLLPAAALGAVGGMTLLTGLATASCYEPCETSWSRRRTSIVVMASTATVGGLFGLASVIGSAVLGLALLLGAASPTAIRWYFARLGARPVADRIVVTEHTTAELCRHWQDSYEHLQHATTPAARLHVVMTRQHCLDELERRHPEGLNAWLGSTASAAGDPSSFLTDH